jgi:hypothetical protein
MSVLYFAPPYQYGSVVSANTELAKSRMRGHADHKKSSPRSERREEIAQSINPAQSLSARATVTAIKNEEVLKP